MKLSVIVPVYNEQNTVEKIIKKIKTLKKINKQIIIVDDGSSDNTKDILKRKLLKNVDKIIFHKNNFGKGAAIRSGQKFIKGDVVIIQDADLEYDPKDYYRLLKPFRNKRVKVVYGSRVLKKKKYKLTENFWVNFRVFANQVLTMYSNILNSQNLTDAHTCYKVFRADLFRSIKLQENDFAFCPEVTTKISNQKIEILEVPISYTGRTYKEGKKINLIDGIKALAVIIKYKFYFN